MCMHCIDCVIIFPFSHLFCHQADHHSAMSHEDNKSSDEISVFLIDMTLSKFGWKMCGQDVFVVETAKLVF